MIDEITGYNLITTTNSNVSEPTWVPLSPSFTLTIQSIDELATVMECINHIQYQLHLPERYKLSFQLFEYIVEFVDIPLRQQYIDGLYLRGWFSEPYTMFIDRLSQWATDKDDNEHLIRELNRLKLLGNP